MRIPAWAVLAFCLSLGVADAVTLPVVVRGTPTVLLRAGPGRLQVVLHKQDLNIYDGSDEITAELWDNAHTILRTVSISDDGHAGAGPGPGQVLSARMEIERARAGIYRLVIAGSGDAVFGLEASCEGCVVRGPVALNNAEIGGKVVFQPPARELKLTGRALHQAGAQQVAVDDAAGTRIGTLSLPETAENSECTIAADVGDRSGPWSLDIARMDVHLVPAGVDTWSIGPDAFFIPEREPYALGPWHSLRYLQPGGEALIRLRAHNRTTAPAQFFLEATGNVECAFDGAGAQVDVSPGAVADVRMRVRVPAAARIGDVYGARVTLTSAAAPDRPASADVEVRIGRAPAERVLDLPILLERYRHENLLFGYAPEYPPHPVHFAPDNRPFICSTDSVSVLRENRWTSSQFREALHSAFPGLRLTTMLAGQKVAFDAEGNAYVFVRVAKSDNTPSNAIACSPDGGQSFSIHDTGMPKATFDIEQFTGHNALGTIPPVLCYENLAQHPAQWAAINRLSLYLPRLIDGKPTLGSPIVISDNCIGPCMHSGGPAATATRDGKTHVVWGETTPPEEDVPGVPTYCATYDHATGKLSDRVLLAYAPPPNDSHNAPAICLDSKGYLHVLTGAHGATFFYLNSLKPNDCTGGWTEPAAILQSGLVVAGPDGGDRGAQTYVSLVCGPDDTLYTVFRQWRRGADAYHGGGFYGTLSLQTRPPGQPWSPARPMLIPPVAGYSIFVHKLTIDRRGNLYLAYEYRTSNAEYRDTFLAENPQHTIMTSGDGGNTWKLAQTSDFAARVQKTQP